MHLTLVQPPSLVARSNYLSYIAIPPLWLGYLTAAARQEGHHVTVVDAVGEGLRSFWSYGGKTLRGLDFDEIVAGIPGDSPVVGVSCMFSCAWPIVRDLVLAIRQARPDVTIVLGGEHATAMPQHVLDNSAVDVVVKGEGEETLLALLSALEMNAPLCSVQGISYRDAAGAVHHNDRRGRIRHIDDIPPPDWHDVNVEGYIAMKSPHGAQRGRSMPLLATRGCPYQCTFCTAPNMWTTKWKARNVEKVLDEMETYMRDYGATDFHFEDLTAVIQKSWVLAFADGIRRRGLNITWQLPTGTRSEAFDREIARAMYESGCKNFAFAIESGDEATLNTIRKRMKPRRMFQAAKASMKEGLNVQGLFIFGFPHETWKNMWRTYVTILKCAVLGFTEVNISAFFPMPGTVEFEKLRAQGKITVDDGYFYSLFDYLTLGKHISWNDRLSSAALRRVILFSFFSFFAVSWTLRPWRFVAGVWQLLHGRTENKVFRVLRSLLTGGGFKATKVVAQMPPPPPPPVGEPVLPRHA